MTAKTVLSQDYSAYSAADYAVWKTLFDRQMAALRPTACVEYLDCLGALVPVLAPDHPPRFTELNERLRAAHGWSIEVVPGFLPVDEFFGLLSHRKFCSSTWLRGEDQLDYLEEPDMFHDVFGHIPLYLNEAYADFAERLGKIGVAQAGNEERIVQLQRLYWFTIEFGVLRQAGEVKIYGAGICSSTGETRHLYDNAAVEIRPFVLDEVLKREFVIDEVQNLYFAIESFGQLYGVLDELERRWA